MNHPSQEDLLGYVLGALDAQEQRELQQHIDEHPELEEELLAIRNSLAPLDCLDASGPRPGLARRTCEAVASWDLDSVEVAQRLAFLEQDHSQTEDLAEVVDQDDHDLANHLSRTSKSKTSIHAEAETDLALVESASLARTRERQLLRPASWSMTDMLVGVASIAILGSLLFPAISWQRYHSRIADCQNNLRQVGNAMLLYSSNHDGRFVAIPETGNLSTAGCFAPILKQAGLLEEDSWLACAGTNRSVPVFVPSTQQIENAQSAEELDYYRKTMSGDYGYTFGYCEDGRYAAPRSEGRTNVVLIADRPSIDQPGRISRNHAGNGQNCLFADGRVQFVKGAAYGSDALFENDYGVVAPGFDESDNVIAPSHLSPAVGLQLSLQ